MIISIPRKISWSVTLATSFLLELFCLAFFEQPVLYSTHAAYFNALMLPQTTLLQNFLGLLLVLCRSSLHNTNLTHELLLLGLVMLIFYYTKNTLQFAPTTQWLVISFLLFFYIAIISYFLTPFAAHFPWTCAKIIANIIIIYKITQYSS